MTTISPISHQLPIYESMSRPAGNALAPSAHARVLGYWGLYRSSKREWSRIQFSWPFGVIEVRDDALMFTAVAPLGPLFELLTRRSRYRVPMVVPFESIEHVSVNWGRLASALIASPDPLVELLTFGGFRPQFELILDGLKAHGVTVIRPPGEPE